MVRRVVTGVLSLCLLVLVSIQAGSVSALMSPLVPSVDGPSGGGVLRSDGRSLPVWASTSPLGWAAFVAPTGAPTIPDEQAFSIPENSPASTPVGTVAVEDLEQSSDFLFAILAGNVGSAFNISNEGLLRVNNAAALDAETRPRFDLSVQVTDSELLTDTATVVVNVLNVNEPPTASAIPAVNVNEDAPDTTIILDNYFSDPEDAPLLYSLPNENTYASLLKASIVPAGSQTTLVLDYKANASGSAGVIVAAADPGNLSVQGTVNVTVRPLDDDLPTVTNISLATNEDTSLNFNADMFRNGFTSSEGKELTRIQILSLPANGVLRYDGTPITVPREVEVGDINRLQFGPAANWSGSTSFTWNGRDSVGYAVSPANATINVAAVNDPPTVSNFPMTGSEDAPIAFTSQKFKDFYTDVENIPLARVRIGTLPANGTLRVDGQSVTAGADFPVSQMDGLVFAPNQDWSGTTSFEWNGSDGSAWAQQPATVNITVNARNDAPSLDLNGPAAPGTGFAAQYNTNIGDVALASSLATLTDVDNQNLQTVTVKIENALDGSAERLVANVSGTSIDRSYSASTRTLTLQGPDSVANFVKVIKTVSYINSSATPNTAARQITFRANDGQDWSEPAQTTVTIVNPEITITVEPENQTVISGNAAVFAITVTNTGDVDLADVTWESSVSSCNDGLVTALLEAGKNQKLACTVPAVTQRITNELSVTAVDTTGGPNVSDSTVAIVNVESPSISVDVSPDPAVGDTVPRGADVPLFITVWNPSQSTLKNVTVTTSRHPYVSGGGSQGMVVTDEGDPIPQCAFDVGDLAPGINNRRDFVCTVEDVDAPFSIEVAANGTSVDTNKPVQTDYDRVDINVVDVSIDASTDVFQLIAGKPTELSFSLTLTNNSNVPVTLATLSSLTASGAPLHGNLLSPTNTIVRNNTCASTGLAATIQPQGGTYTCSYTATVEGVEPSFVNRLAFSVTDPDNNRISGSQDIQIAVTTDSDVTVILTAEPPTLIAPGGTIDLLVQIRNDATTEVTLQSLQDAEVGDLDGQGTCSTPQTIAAQDSYLCAYSVVKSGLAAGDELTFVLTAVVDGETLVDDVVVRVTERGTRRMLLPSVASGAVAGEPNNNQCLAMTVMTGLDLFFLADDQNDWYSFELTEPGSLRVHVADYRVDGQLLLYRAVNCVELTNDSLVGRDAPKAGTTTDRLVTLSNAEPGRYFVWVYTADGESSAVPYKLRIDSGGTR